MTEIEVYLLAAILILVDISKLAKCPSHNSIIILSHSQRFVSFLNRVSFARTPLRPLGLLDLPGS